MAEKDAQRFANAFRIVLDIRSNYCNTGTKAKEINKEFELLKVYLTEKELLDKVETIQRRINAELNKEEALAKKHVEEIRDFCELCTEMLIVNSGQIQRIHDIKIPEREEAMVEIVKEFNETLRTIGIPDKVEPEKSLDLTAFQEEVAEVIEEKVEEAFEKFEKPVGDSETYIKLGQFEIDLENYDKALDYFEKAIEFDPDNAIAWFLRGYCYQQVDEWKKALGSYDKALQIDPENTAAWLSKGAAIYQSGEYGEAIRCYDTALAINPRYAGALASKGIILTDLKRHEEAIKCFDRALEIDPNDTVAWHGKGKALNNLKMYEEAIKCFDRVLDIDPNDTDSWCEKGKALNNLKMYEEAARCYKKALEIEIDSNSAAAWLAKGSSAVSLAHLKYNEGRKHEDAGDYSVAREKYDGNKELLEKASTFFKRALELKPNDDFTRETAKRIPEMLASFDAVVAASWAREGMDLADLERLEEAIRCFDKALEIKPNFALTWKAKGIFFKIRSASLIKEGMKHVDARNLRLAREKIYEGKELLEKALASHKRALELDPNDDEAKSIIRRTQDEIIDLEGILSEMYRFSKKET